MLQQLTTGRVRSRLSCFSLPRDLVPAHGRIVRITFSKAGQIRIRKVVTRSRVRKTYRYPSWMRVEEREGESLNEVNGFILADCDPNIEGYAEQCCEIVYINDEGNEARHYPDIFLVLNGRMVFWEIKVTKDAESSEVSDRTKLLIRELPSLGFSYEVKIAEDLAREPRLKVAKHIMRFGRKPLTLLDRWQLQQELNSGSVLTWGNACSGSYGKFGRHVLCRAVLEGVLAIDMNSVVSHNTRFELGILEVWK
jgi:hypothetical protein